MPTYLTKINDPWASVDMVLPVSILEKREWFIGVSVTQFPFEKDKITFSVPFLSHFIKENMEKSQKFSSL